VVEYWGVCLKRENLTSTTHYYIIGRQYTIEAHKNLVEKGEISNCDKSVASTFNIISIWAIDANTLDIMHLSKVLNQNIVGEQKEHTFLMQFVYAQLKWRDIGSPQPSMMRRIPSPKYLVSSLTIFFFSRD